MADLSLSELGVVSDTTASVLALVQLDDWWTSRVSRRRPRRHDDAAAAEVEEGSRQVIANLGRVAQFVPLLVDIIGQHDVEANETLKELLWGSVLSPGERDDLRLLTAPYGSDVLNLGEHALSLVVEGWESEVSGIKRQMESMSRGQVVGGDLTRPFRCGLALALVSGGVLALPVGGAGGAAALAAGAAVAAAAGVALVGGIGAIAIIGFGLLLARQNRC